MFDVVSFQESFLSTLTFVKCHLTVKLLPRGVKQMLVTDLFFKFYVIIDKIKMSVSELLLRAVPS